jgi:hypothetical protein
LIAEITRLDRVLVLVLLVFAFFLGSTVAHNSDVWLHLATGRLQAKGQYSFGSDPFTYTSGAHPWINHAWLTQRIAYQIWQSLGGVDSAVARAVLVLVKAFLVVVLAWVMLLVRRQGQSLWLPVACVALALYAMSPRLFLQPAILSYLCLALTLYVLFRWRMTTASVRDSQRSPRSWGSLLTLPVLFALWVNLDEWFLLGPLMVALFLLGEIVQFFAVPADSSDRLAPRDLGVLSAVLLLGIGACFLSPFTVNGLTLPTELWAFIWGRDLQADPWFQQYFFSGLARDYLTNFGAWAYAVLVGLGLSSFVLVRGEFHWWRLTVWSAFALFSAFGMARSIPFFAVIAGPITALNLQDFAVKQFGAAPRVEGNLKNWSLWGRLGSACLGVLLLAAAWPGYLHPSPEDARRSRRVAWDVEADPSLQKAAEKLCELRAKGVLKSESRGFNSNPDIANYCAWFCPAEQSFFDYRLQLFSDVLKTYTDTKVAIHPKAADPAQEAAKWRSVFTNPKYNINHLIINHPDQTATLPVVERLWRDGNEWTLLYMDGQTTIFGWDNALEPSHEKVFPKHRLSMSELAFGKAIPAAVRAPEDGAEAPEKQNFWAWYASGPARRPLEVEEVGMYLTFAEDMSIWLQKNAVMCNFVGSWTVPVTAAPTSPGSLIYTATLGPLIALSPRDLYAGVQTSPPGALLMAVRAARRAIARSPENPDGYLALAQAYNTLWQSQERLWGPTPSSILERARRTVVVNAYKSAQTLRPEDAAIHFALAEQYARMNYVDLEMDAWEKGLRALRAAGPRPRQPPDDFNKRVAAYEELLHRREQATRIQDLRNDYELAAAGKAPLIKAQLALRNGLAQQAIEVLSEADPAQLGQRGEGAQLLFQLYTDTGRGEEVTKAGFRVDDFQQVLLKLVAGNYKLAREDLGKMAKIREHAAINALLGLSWAQVFQGQVQPSSAADLAQFVRMRDEITDLDNLRAILALEEGETREAARILEETLKEKPSASKSAEAVAPLAASAPFGAASLMDAESRVQNPMLFEPATRPIAVQYAKLLKAQGN